MPRNNDNGQALPLTKASHRVGRGLHWIFLTALLCLTAWSVMAAPSGRLVPAGDWELPRPAILDPYSCETLNPDDFWPATVAGYSVTTLTDGRLLIWGGLDAADTPQPTGLLYDTRTGSSQTLADPQARARAGHSALLLADGRVLIHGGVDAEGVLVDDAAVFDPDDDRMRALPGFVLAPRAAHDTLLMLDGRLLIVGGVGTEGTPLVTAQIWDPQTGAAETLATYPALGRLTPRLHDLGDGRVLVAGGTETTGVVCEDGVILDIATGSAERVRPEDVDYLLASLQESNGFALTQTYPLNGEQSVPSDALLAVAFNRPAARDSATAETFTLLGLEGEVPLGVTLAEDGRRVYLRPQVELYPDATYTLFIDGLTDRDGRGLEYTVIGFSTAAYLPEGWADTDEVPAADAAYARGAEAETNSAAANLDSSTHISGIGSSAKQQPLRIVAGQGADGARAKSAEQSGASNAGSQALDAGEVFLPQDRHRGGRWYTGRALPASVRALRDGPRVKTLRAKTKTQRTALKNRGNFRPLKPEDLSIVADTGQSGVSGQVLTLDDKPLAGVTVTIGKHKARTGKDGRFTLADIPAGRHEMFVDGGTARGRQFAETLIGVDVAEGKMTDLPFAIFLPRIRPQDWVRLPSPLPREAVITHPDLPGLELHLPKGTVLRDRAGKVVKRIAITPVPLDRAPYPVPERFAMYFNVQPAGVRIQGLTPEATGGIRVIYGNTFDAPPGARGDLWYYDPLDRGWFVYGQAQVSADGERIEPDPGVGLYEALGVSFSLNQGPPPPPDGSGDCDSSGMAGGAGGSGGSPGVAWAGDPVHCATGLFLLERDDISLNDVAPLNIHRVYRSGDSVSRAFGKGTNHLFGAYLWNANGGYQSVDLVLPDGNRVHFERTSPGTVPIGAVFEYRAAASVFYGAVIRLEPDPYRWELTLRDGRVYEFHYTAGNPLIGMKDRHGNRLSIERSAGRVDRVTTPSGRFLDFTYDADNRITAITDIAGRQVTYEYDAAGYLSRFTDAAGHSERYEYDADGNMTRVIDRRGHVQVQNTYDAEGRISHQVVADSSDPALAVAAEWDFAYVTDAGGDIIQTDITDPRGVVRRLEFNDQGAYVRETKALGTPQQQVTSVERDPTDQRALAMVDALGRRTAYAYDTDGRLSAATRLAGTADAQTTNYTYTADHRLASRTDALGNTSTYTYDTAGNLRTSTDPLGNTSSYTYDTYGKLLTSTDPNGHTTHYSYDGHDLYQVTDPLGRSRRVFTDLVGQTLGRQDPRGEITQYRYDANGRLTGITDPLNQTTTLEYDAEGNLTALTDPAGSRTQFHHDAANRRIGRTDPLGQTESFTYDDGDKLTAHTDRAGQTSTHSYDPLGRRTASSYADGASLSYTYDAGGRLTTVNDSQGGLIQHDYDGLDRLIEETTPLGRVGYRYDALGRRSALELPGQPDTLYDYDAAGRLQQIQRGTATVGAAYDAGGRTTDLSYGNGIDARYTYDAANQLGAIAYEHNGSPLGDLSYGHDASGRVTAKGGSLASTALPMPLASAGYDANHRVTDRGATTYSHDANGNLIDDGSRTYHWDARNRLTEIREDGVTVASFTYDAFGRRTRKTIGTEVTQYLYDGDNPVRELDAAGQPTAELITGLGLDQFLVRIAGGNSYYYLGDHLGSTIALADSSGALAAEYVYDPYGNVTTSGDDAGNPFQYIGRENDGTGLYYYRARYYDPKLQRFIAEDPIFFEGGINLYGYTFGDPINWIDQDGTRPISVGGRPGLGGGRGTTGNPRPKGRGIGGRPGGWVNGRFYPSIGLPYRPPVHSEPSSRSPIRPQTDRILAKMIRNLRERQAAADFFHNTLQQFPSPEDQPWPYSDYSDLIPDKPEVEIGTCRGDGYSAY